jgi:hypothetical protein
MPRKLTSKQEAKTGRPSDYTEELGTVICARLAEGESMRKIAKDEDMPSTTTMFTWIRTHAEFLAQYEISKAECADMYAEEIIEIADDSANDYVEVTDENGATGATRLNTEHVQRSRLRIDSRKWVAAKLKPKKYGEKIQHDVDAKIKTTDMSESELDNKLQALMDATGITKQTTED